MGDTPEYLRFANLFSSPSEWLWKSSTTVKIPNVTHMRLIGYPFLIFISKLVSENFWAWILIIFHFFIHGLAIFYLLSFLKSLRFPFYLICLPLLFLGLGWTFTVGPYLLTDSLYASLALIFSTFCLRLFVQFSRKDILIACLSLTGLFLLRNTTTIYFCLHIPVLALYVFQNNWKKSISFLLPVFLVLPCLYSLYGAWNLQRFDRFFVSNMSYYVLSEAVFSVIQGEDTWKLDPIVEKTKKDFGDYPLLRAERDSQYWKIYNTGLSARLFKNLSASGLKHPVDWAKYLKSIYLRLWLEHPQKMIWHMKEEIIKKSYLIVHPLTYAMPQGFRILPKLTWDSEKFFSLLFFFCSFGVFFKSRKTLLDKAFVFVQIAAIGYFLFHAAFHIEERYIIPSLHLIILTGNYFLFRLFGKIDLIRCKLIYKS